MSSHSLSQQYPSMTSFFSGHILGPHRGTVPFSKHHEQRAEERVRERESAQFAVDQHSAQAARFTTSPVCWQWQIFCCSWGPASFCPACFTWTPAHCFWTLTEVTRTEYTFSQSIGLHMARGLSLLRREMRMDRRRKRLKTEQERIDKEDDLCQS